MDAYAKSRTPQQDRDKRATPAWVYDAICWTLGVRPVWDVCAEQHTAVRGVKGFWSADDDALSIDWHAEIGRHLGQGLHVAWMNPPYSAPGAWCKKAELEASKGLIVVGLLPDDRSVNWYQMHVHNKASAVFLPPTRIPFVLPETGEEQNGNPKGSLIPIWAPWRTGGTAESYILQSVWSRFKPNKRARQ